MRFVLESSMLKTRQNNFPTIRITALFLISVLIVSCRGGSGTMFNAATLPYKVDIEKYYDNVKPVTLSTIGEELVYVPLETRPDLVLGQVQPLSVEVYDSLIFINDSKQLYLFDINGKFIRKIGRIGRGPGEYLLPYFTVDNDNRLVYVGGSDKINCFDFDGNDMGSFALDFYVLNFIVNNDGTILFPKRKLFDTLCPLAGFGFGLVHNRWQRRGSIKDQVKLW